MGLAHFIAPRVRFRTRACALHALQAFLDCSLTNIGLLIANALKFEHTVPHLHNADDTHDSVVYDVAGRGLSLLLACVTFWGQQFSLCNGKVIRAWRGQER